MTIGTPIDFVTIYADAAGDWRWRVVATNGRTLADSGEGYANRSHAVEMAGRLFPGATIRDDE
jgi:hypothetical protein